jgi:2-haloacid dehalogenase
LAQRCRADAERILKPLGYALNWIEFADAAGPLPTHDGRRRSGRRPFVKLDVLHREMLEKIRPRFRLEKLDPGGGQSQLAWHRLDGWPDVAAGYAACTENSCWRPARMETSR